MDTIACDFNVKRLLNGGALYRGYKGAVNQHRNYTINNAQTPAIVSSVAPHILKFFVFYLRQAYVSLYWQRWHKVLHLVWPK